MSCCGGHCGCGDACKCGTGCQGCKMYPDTSYSENTGTAEILIGGVAPQSQTKYFEGCDNGVAAENGGCKCGANCTCNPCTCK